MKILGNNKTNFILTKNLENQNCIKHINMMHYYLQGLVEEGQLGIKWIPSLLMFADGLTKALSAEFFKNIETNRV